MIIFWSILLILLIILEASTAQFICIWFAGGALAALICSMFELSVLIQVVTFVVVTSTLLFSTKKIVRKLRGSNIEKTNTDAIIGKIATVTEAISNLNSTGCVKLGGMTWSARSATGENIMPGQAVVIEKIDGVKLIVRPVYQS